MAQLVVRNIEESVKARLQRRANRHGQSMEAEARDILRSAVAADQSTIPALGSRLSARFAGVGLDEDVAELRGQKARAIVLRR